MSAKTSLRLINDPNAVTTDENFDPILDPGRTDELDSFIQVTQRPNPGLSRVFNGERNRPTSRIEVIGLLLNFSNNPSTRLTTVLNRRDVSDLYIYADTIRVSTRLHFPQTNVHIFARRLIFQGNGEIDTTPTDFSVESASGGTPENMARGLNAPDAGSIFLNVRELTEQNRGTKIHAPLIMPREAFRLPSAEKVFYSDVRYRFFPEGSTLDLNLNNNSHGEISILLTPTAPTRSWRTLPKKFIRVTIDLQKGNGSSLQIEEVGGRGKSISKKLRNSSPGNLQLVFEKGKLSIRSGRTDLLSFTDSDSLESVHFLGFRNEGGAAELLNETSLTIRQETPAFTANGGRGQNGQIGDRISRETNHNPVTRLQIWNWVRTEDVFHAPNNRWNKAWSWPDLSRLENNQVLFAKVTTRNHSRVTKNRTTHKTFGNAEAENPHSGLDAYASGNGGNGGTGGTIETTGAACPPSLFESFPGPFGISQFIPGTKRTGTESAYRVEMQVVHSNTVRDARPERLRPVGPSWQTVPAQEAIQPSQTITTTLLSRDGRDGIGNDGKKGTKGKRVKISGQSKAWIHPNLMEGIVHFTRAQFMDGNRSTAQWLLNHYATELDELEEQGIYSGFQFNELLHQIRDLANRLDSRLDYFGNPVGWVPRLGTVANIDITRLVVQNAVRLIHFSNDLLTRSRQEDEIRDQLSFAIDQIHKEVENDRIRLADAHRELPGIQRELLSIQNDVDALNTKIRDLHFEVKIRYREREFEQNLFTGGLNILSGLTNLIPVGQPFVGQIAGSILDQVAKIQLHSDNPLGEATRTASGIASELGGFIKTNQKELRNSINSNLSGQIEKINKSIKSTEKDTESFREDLESHQSTFNFVFQSNTLNVLKQHFNLDSVADSFESHAFFSSEDFSNSISNLQNIRKEVRTHRALPASTRQAIQEDLGKVIGEQKKLKTTKAQLERQQKQRNKALEAAGLATQQIGRSITGIATGLNVMFARVDEDDPQFQKAINNALQDDEFGERFRTLQREVNELNEIKSPIASRLLNAQQIIHSTSGTIISRMNQIATFTDQRSHLAIGALSTMTQLYLRDVVSNSHEMILRQMDNLIRSFEYQFLQSGGNQSFRVNRLVEEILEFNQQGEDQASEFVDYQNAYDFALRSQFNSMAKKLLGDLQSTARGHGLPLESRILPGTKTRNGLKILDELNQFGSVTFRIPDLHRASQDWLDFRILNVQFTGIKVKTKLSNLSINLAIHHSGESVIRSHRNREQYFFTTVNSSALGVDNETNRTFRTTWDAIYNQTHAEGDHNGITNQEIQNEDERTFLRFLSDVNLNDDSNGSASSFTEMRPGGTSELTLYIENPELTESERRELTRNFQIKELRIEVRYHRRN